VQEDDEVSVLTLGAWRLRWSGWRKRRLPFFVCGLTGGRFIMYARVLGDEQRDASKRLDLDRTEEDEPRLEPKQLLFRQSRAIRSSDGETPATLRDKGRGGYSTAR
jgi:hypothetical protein